MRHRTLLATAALAAAATVVAQPAAAQPAGLANPAHNAPALSMSACFAKGGQVADYGSLACTRSQLAAIDKARAAEGLVPMLLPGWYPKLTIPEQLLVVTDLERQARGLPIFVGLSASLDAMARKGAVAGADPVDPIGASWGSNWEGGFPTALSADFGWMYDDGPGSGNLACVPANMTGCWGHRDNILGDYGPAPVMGAASVPFNGTRSMTELFATAAPGPLAWRLPGRIGAGPGGITGPPAPAATTTTTTVPLHFPAHMPPPPRHPAPRTGRVA